MKIHGRFGRAKSVIQLNAVLWPVESKPEKNSMSPVPALAHQLFMFPRHRQLTIKHRLSKRESRRRVADQNSHSRLPPHQRPGFTQPPQSTHKTSIRRSPALLWFLLSICVDHPEIRQIQRRLNRITQPLRARPSIVPLQRRETVHVVRNRVQLVGNVHGPVQPAAFHGGGAVEDVDCVPDYERQAEGEPT